MANKEVRKLRITIGKAGGNASASAVNYGLRIPSAWAQEMKIVPEARDVIVTFNGKKITIEKDTPTK